MKEFYKYVGRNYREDTDNLQSVEAIEKFLPGNDNEANDLLSVSGTFVFILYKRIAEDLGKWISFHKNSALIGSSIFICTKDFCFSSKIYTW